MRTNLLRYFSIYSTVRSKEPKIQQKPDHRHLYSSSLKFNNSSLPTSTTTNGITTNGHSDSHSAHQSVPTLAGVESQLNTLTSHIVNSLTSRQFSSSSSSSSAPSTTLMNKLSAASGVLVTGASGSGKTALIKEIGRKMEKDPRTFTRKFVFFLSLSLSFSFFHFP